MVRGEHSAGGGEGERRARAGDGGGGESVQERGELSEGEEVWAVRCLLKKGEGECVCVVVVVVWEGWKGSEMEEME